MSNSDSDNSGVWWIAIISVIMGIIFFFDKSFWPGLESPVLRCLLAPIAGVVLMFFYSGVWVSWLLQIIWNFIRWLTSPAVVLLMCILLLASGGLALVFRWASPPLMPFWAISGGAAAGTLGGFIMLHVASVVPHNPWHVKATMAFPVAAGLSYWATNKLLAAVEPALYWIAIVLAAILLGRILWVKESIESQTHATHVKQSSSLRAADLPNNVREQLLEKIRDQLGTAQFNQLIKAMGEDGVIDLVVKQMSNNK